MDMLFFVCCILSTLFMLFLLGSRPYAHALLPSFLPSDYAVHVPCFLVNFFDCPSLASYPSHTTAQAHLPPSHTKY